MKRRFFCVFVTIILVLTMMPASVFALYVPPTSYQAPSNVGVVFNGDDLDVDESGRWSFDIGYSATDEIRELVKANEDGSLEEAGFDSFHVSVQGDYKLDSGAWRSEKSGYEDWVNNQEADFSYDGGVWTSGWHIYDAYFDEVIPDGILPGGKAYFDNHTMQFRLRFCVDFYHSESGEDYLYYSPWSETVSYTNSQKKEDPEKLINHTPKLLSAELKKHDDGQPYLDFRADQAHSDVQRLNSISNQRVFTNVWLSVNGGSWVDAGTYLWMKEQFEVDADDYFANVVNYDAAVYEAKFRYSFDYDYYPAAGKTGDIYSPFSNVISNGMPSYEGASSWAKTELDKAAGYDLITDRIKGNMSGKVTREEFAEIAVKLYEKYTGKTAEAGNTSFTDTTNPEILKAANLGLVQGVGNGKYAPNTLVTREQMATILFRALKVINPEEDFSTSGTVQFTDDALIKQWAKEGVYYCAEKEIVTGMGNNSYNPEGDATREQAVIVCTRAYEYYKN